MQFILQTIGVMALLVIATFLLFVILKRLLKLEEWVAAAALWGIYIAAVSAFIVKAIS